MIEIAGRSLKVPRAAGGVARFSFAELCESPLGARDYIAIVEAFHTVFVTDVPRLPRERHNEARRFTIFVDTLYDRGRRLVVSAASPPDDIHAGPGLGGEFARTVSRLHEMGSQAYWQARQDARSAKEIGSPARPASLAANPHPG